MIQRILTMAWKEAKQLQRDPRLFPILFIAPILQLTLLGYGATFDIKNLPIAVWDQSRTAESRAYIRAFTPTEYFVVKEPVNNYREAAERIDRGRAVIVLVLPTDFGRRLRGGRPVTVQAILDGSNSNTALIGLNYINRITEAFSSNIELTRVQASEGPALPDRERGAGELENPVGSIRTGPRISIDNRLRVWYNPELLSKNYMIPGVIAVLLIVITSMMTALGIVKEKEIGTLEQLVITPLRRSELMIGKLLPFVAIGFIDIGIVLLFGIFWFDVPVRGSIPLLFALAAVYILTTLGLGLFVSTISRTQNQAQLTIFFIMLPLMILSGFAFPIANMPVFFQDLSYLSPVRYFLVIIRGIFLKGEGIDTLWPQVVPLAVLAVAIFSMSVLRFRRTLG
ncbi:MAG TPA: ABC transporter permease [Nitrospiria bacterium]|jgi:ABC-2 type transport system permease protein|nr:ABC transporter permease [Nitrospiria bacterium]